MADYQNRPLTANALVIYDNSVVLIKRKNDPFKDFWAIPGGFVEITETAAECAVRELKEETGLTGKALKLVGLYDDSDRDPTRHTACACNLVSVESLEGMKAGDDAGNIKAFPLNDFPPLAFDHKKMIADAL